jgi:hypothetical protein
MQEEHPLVTAYVRAMQRGTDGQDELLSLFHDDGQYVEHFSGQPQVHQGRSAIAEWLAGSLQYQPPDISITIDGIDIDGQTVRAAWTCESSAFESPARGIDTYDTRAGLIQRLETVITHQPRLRASD